LYSCRIAGWKFVLYVQSVMIASTQVDNLLKEILIDFNLEINSENMDWLKKDIGDLISLYEKKYDIRLQEYMRSVLERLVIRMAYDKICFKGMT
jgi:hypothetical protein